MKRKVLLPALALLVGAFTSPPDGSTTPSGDTLDCVAFEQYAEASIDMRQNGLPFTEALATADEAGDETTRKVLRMIVTQAYALPDFRTPEYQQHQRREFANEVARLCVETVRKHNEREAR